MEFRHLRYFLAVAQELHFGRAAQHLQMAQPPLSQQIKQLEQEMGVLLFERTRRRVKLTTAGRVFQTEAKQVLAHLEQAVLKTQQASRGEIGELAIAFVSSAMYSLLPATLKQFRRQYPQVSIALHELTTAEQIPHLLNHRLDIGFARPPIHHPELISQSVLQEPLVAVVPAHHMLARCDRLSIQTLASESFILFPRSLGMGLYDQIISFCRQGGFSPQVVQKAVQMQTILSLVSADIGVSIVPRSLQHLQRSGICFIPFVEATPLAEVCMIWDRQELSSVGQQFIASLLSVESTND